MTMLCRFSSWTYDGLKVDLTEQSGADTYIYEAGCSYQLISEPDSQRNENHYECCPEPYVDLTIRLQLAPSAERRE